MSFFYRYHRVSTRAQKLELVLRWVMLPQGHCFIVINEKTPGYRNRNQFSGGLFSCTVIVLSLTPSKHQGIEIGTGSQVGYHPAGSLFYRYHRVDTRVQKQELVLRWVILPQCHLLSLPPSKHQGIEIGTGSQVGYAPTVSFFIATTE